MNLLSNFFYVKNVLCLQSRVVSQNVNERSFHVFYQIIDGTPREWRGKEEVWGVGRMRETEKEGLREGGRREEIKFKRMIGEKEGIASSTLVLVLNQVQVK